MAHKAASAVALGMKNALEVRWGRLWAMCGCRGIQGYPSSFTDGGRCQALSSQLWIFVRIFLGNDQSTDCGAFCCSAVTKSVDLKGGETLQMCNYR